MAQDIAKLSVMISATASPMNAVVDGVISKLNDLKTAALSMTGFGSAFETLGKAVGQALEGRLADAASTALDAFKGMPPVVYSLVNALNAVPYVGPVLAAGANAATRAFETLKDVSIGWLQEFIAMSERGAAQLREMNRLSKVLGFSLAEAAAVQLLGNQLGDQGAFMQGMNHMRRALANARQGGLETTLAFQRLGVTFAAIDRGNTAEIFERIADAVARGGDMNAIAANVRAIFGRGSQEMMGALAKGSELFRQAQIRALRFGLVPTGEQLKLVTEAKFAQQQMAADWAALFQGLERRAAVALAPLWTAIASGSDTLITRMEPAFAGVRTVIDAVGRAAQNFATGFSIGFERFAPQIDAIARTFRDIGDLIVYMLTGSSGFAVEWKDIGEFVAGMLVTGFRSVLGLMISIAQIGVELWQTFRGWVGTIDAAINGIRSLYTMMVTAAMNLARAIDPTGELFMRLAALPSVIGSNSNLAGGMRDMADVLERLNQAQLRLQGQGLRTRTELAVDRASQSVLESVQAALQRGPGLGVAGTEITAAMFSQARNAATQGPQLPPVLAAGSAADISLRNRLNVQESPADIARRMADSIQDQLRVQQEQRDIDREVLRILQERGITVAPANMP